MIERTNDEWLFDLKHPGKRQEEALEDLREYLLRAVLVYMRDHRSDLEDLDIDEIRQMAEDLAQDALLAIRENLDTFRGQAKFTTWAYRFVINGAISMLRRRKRSSLSYEELQEMKSAALTVVLEDDKVDARLISQRRNVVLLLRQIIDSELTELQRSALLAVYFEGRSVAEVAEVLDMSANALYKLLHDARKKIKHQLQARRYSAGDILALFDEDW